MSGLALISCPRFAYLTFAWKGFPETYNAEKTKSSEMNASERMKFIHQLFTSACHLGFGALSCSSHSIHSSRCLCFA